MGPRKRRRSQGEGMETLANRKAAITLPGRRPADNAAAYAGRLTVSARSIAAQRDSAVHDELNGRDTPDTQPAT
jgi:hypothetical protein